MSARVHQEHEPPAHSSNTAERADAAGACVAAQHRRRGGRDVARRSVRLAPCADGGGGRSARTTARQWAVFCGCEGCGQRHAATDESAAQVDEWGGWREGRRDAAADKSTGRPQHCLRGQGRAIGGRRGVVADLVTAEEKEQVSPQQRRRRPCP